MEILPEGPVSTTPPKFVIEISDDESQDLEREPEQAGEQYIVKVKQENIQPQQTLDLGTNILTHKDNLTHNTSDVEPNQPTRNDGNDPPVQGDDEAVGASEETYRPREDSESDPDDDDYDYETVSEHDDEEPAFNDGRDQSLDAGKDSAGLSRQPTPTRGQTEVDVEPADEYSAFNEQQSQSSDAGQDSAGLSRQPAPLDDEELEDEELEDERRDFGDWERQLMGRLEDIPRLPEQPNPDATKLSIPQLRSVRRKRSVKQPSQSWRMFQQQLRDELDWSYHPYRLQILRSSKTLWSSRNRGTKRSTNRRQTSSMTEAV